jgi:hypothetical protein
VFLINGFISVLGAAPSGWMTDNLPGHALLAGSLAIQVGRPPAAKPRAASAHRAASGAGGAALQGVGRTRPCSRGDQARTKDPAPSGTRPPRAQPGAQPRTARPAGRSSASLLHEPSLPQAVGLLFVGNQSSLAAVAAVFGLVAVTWNIVNTAGNVLSLQQAPQVRGVGRAWGGLGSTSTVIVSTPPRPRRPRRRPRRPRRHRAAPR